MASPIDDDTETKLIQPRSVLLSSPQLFPIYLENRECVDLCSRFVAPMDPSSNIFLKQLGKAVTDVNDKILMERRQRRMRGSGWLFGPSKKDRKDTEEAAATSQTLKKWQDRFIR